LFYVILLSLGMSSFQKLDMDDDSTLYVQHTLFMDGSITTRGRVMVPNGGELEVWNSDAQFGECQWGNGHIIITNGKFLCEAQPAPQSLGYLELNGGSFSQQGDLLFSAHNLSVLDNVIINSNDVIILDQLEIHPATKGVEYSSNIKVNGNLHIRNKLIIPAIRVDDTTKAELISVDGYLYLNETAVKLAYDELQLINGSTYIVARATLGIIGTFAGTEEVGPLKHSLTVFYDTHKITLEYTAVKIGGPVPPWVWVMVGAVALAIVLMLAYIISRVLEKRRAGYISLD